MYRSSVYQAITPIVLRGFGPVHVALYRLLRGRLVGRISQGFMPVLLLTTVGRRSGRRRTQPVGYVRDGDALLVVASNGALTSPPGWYFNLRANPAAQVELGGERMNVTSTILLREERERAWRVVTMKYPFFHVYQRSVGRVIPVVRLHRDHDEDPTKDPFVRAQF